MEENANEAVSENRVEKKSLANTDGKAVETDSKVEKKQFEGNKKQEDYSKQDNMAINGGKVNLEKLQDHESNGSSSAEDSMVNNDAGKIDNKQEIETPSTADLSKDNLPPEKTTGNLDSNSEPDARTQENKTDSTDLHNGEKDSIISAVGNEELDADKLNKEISAKNGQKELKSKADGLGEQENLQEIKKGTPSQQDDSISPSLEKSEAKDLSSKASSSLTSASDDSKDIKLPKSSAKSKDDKIANTNVNKTGDDDRNNGGNEANINTNSKAEAEKPLANNDVEAIDNDNGQSKSNDGTLQKSENKQLDDIGDSNSRNDLGNSSKGKTEGSESKEVKLSEKGVDSYKTVEDKGKNSSNLQSDALPKLASEQTEVTGGSKDDDNKSDAEDKAQERDKIGLKSCESETKDTNSGADKEEDSSKMENGSSQEPKNGGIGNMEADKRKEEESAMGVGKSENSSERETNAKAPDSPSGEATDSKPESSKTTNGSLLQNGSAVLIEDDKAEDLSSPKVTSEHTKSHIDQLLRYNPGATLQHGTRSQLQRVLRRYAFQSINISVFGYPNSGKSALINTMNYAVNTSYEELCCERKVFCNDLSSLTNKRQYVTITEEIGLVDNKGMEDFSSNVLHEVARQCEGYRGKDDFIPEDWNHGIKTTAKDMLKYCCTGKLTRVNDSIHCPIIVFSLDGQNEPESLSPLIDVFQKACGSPPVIVMTHYDRVREDKDLVQRRKRQFQNLHCARMFCIENYTYDSHDRKTETDKAVADILAACCLVSDQYFGRNVTQIKFWAVLLMEFSAHAL